MPCGDSRNGFGPGAVFNQETGARELGAPNRGFRRSEITFDMNYHTNDLFKVEWRHDFSNLNSFLNEDGSLTKHNTTFGPQTVVTF